MGGSGGGSGGFGGGLGGSGGGGGGDELSCDSLTEETIIASPVAAAIPKLAEGELLSLVLSKNDKPPVRAEKADGTFIGTVMPTFLVKLVDCMQSGSSYHAEVLSIDGGAVSIEIRPGDA